MRKIIVMMPVSADGFIEGQERELNLHKVDDRSIKCVGSLVRPTRDSRLSSGPAPRGCAGGRSYQPSASRIAEVGLYRPRIGPRP
jgi:hypothetical protein